jgi:hypothetical protein
MVRYASEFDLIAFARNRIGSGIGPSVPGGGKFDGLLKQLGAKSRMRRARQQQG